MLFCLGRISRINGPITLILEKVLSGTVTPDSTIFYLNSSV